jgi:hypothetical protein
VQILALNPIGLDVEFQVFFFRDNILIVKLSQVPYYPSFICKVPIHLCFELHNKIVATHV